MSGPTPSLEAAPPSQLAGRGPLRRRRRVWLLLLAGAAVALTAFAWWRSRPGTVRYVTAPVSRGGVVRTIIATGTVNPVVTVQVGSYVSGTIQVLYCDYNTQVKANQLCAKIDPRPYQVVVDQESANVSSARAQLAKDRAALVYARLNYQRDSGLNAQGVASQDNVDSDKSTLDQTTAQVALDSATLAQHQAGLHAARVNLAYTDIVSPVVGTVISRNVDVGQTVAASFQTPTLFLVAKDLTRMQVDASVSESDIGAVSVGQRASFAVEAYPNKTFWGQVVQLRRAPITVQNVVTYDVVIGVSNPDLLLLPGMTANTNIITAERDSVLRIPLTALRYVPRGLSSDTTAHHRAHGAGQVWVLRQGQPQAVPVVTGLDDGTYAEVVKGALTADDQVVVNQVETSGGGGSASQANRPVFRF